MPHDDEKTFVVVDEEESPPFTLEEFRSSNDGDPLVDMYAVDLEKSARCGRTTGSWERRSRSRG